MAQGNDVTLFDGSGDFSEGVDSLSVTTVRSERTPNGLSRNELAWLVNSTVRGGAIAPRSAWILKGRIHDSTALFQGASIYEPDSANPYIICLIGGNTYQVDPDFLGQPVNLTKQFPATAMPATQPRANFAQGEKYLIIQAGDNVTLPLFWDGTTLRRSKGITNTAVAPGTPGVNEIPAGTAMVYYQGRLWYAQQRAVNAGDIVGGPSGTAANQFRDAILEVTENPLVVGGDGFIVPSNAGNIRGLAFPATLDTTLGQGSLMIFTRKAIYSLTVPVTRADWIATNVSNGPIMAVVQNTNGSVNDISIVSVNGDLFFQSLEPSIRSLMVATRFFQQWNNPPTSNNENRILQFVNRALMSFSGGVTFDNRLLQLTLPMQTPQGVIHKALLPLDFSPISTLQKQLPPVWEGHQEGLDYFTLLRMDFGGLDRCFAVVRNRTDFGMDLWELVPGARFDSPDNRIDWQCEFPAFTFGDETKLKKLTGAEFWLDSVSGTVVLKVEYRPDSDTCWHLWKEWEICSPRNSSETVINPIPYPLVPFCDSYRSTQTLPIPPDEDCESATGRPAYIGYQFQVRMTIKGYCRIRSISLFGQMRERELHANMVC